jgi:hypothetical protein
MVARSQSCTTVGPNVALVSRSQYEQVRRLPAAVRMHSPRRRNGTDIPQLGRQEA